MSTDTELACALAANEGRRHSFNDTQYDESLARSIQEEEIAGYESTLGADTLPELHTDHQQLRLERTLSERLAESGSLTQHIPRTNSVEEAPCYSEISADRQRMQERLAMYSLCEREVKGDGNCQFRALSDQLYRSPGYYDQLRRAAVEQLRSHPEQYAPYVAGDWEDYLRLMAKSGTWGDHLTLQAIADRFGVKMYIVTSYREGDIIEINPNGPLRSERVLYLSFWAEVHYNSVFPRAEPPPQLPNDKTLGSRRLYHILHGEVY
ncbi:g10217 [Coccomyxa elongata]